MKILTYLFSRKIIIFIVILIAFMLNSGCSSEPVKVSTEDKKQTAEATLLRFAQKYNASTSWDSEIRSKVDKNKQIFTDDVQRLLLSNIKEPKLFRHTLLSDIYTEYGKIFAVFDDNELLGNYHIIVEISPSVKQRLILEDNSSFYNPFAIIINISNVEEVKFLVKAHPQNSDEADLRFETDNPALIHGYLVDYMKI